MVEFRRIKIKTYLLRIICPRLGSKTDIKVLIYTPFIPKFTSKLYYKFYFLIIVDLDTQNLLVNSAEVIDLFDAWTTIFPMCQHRGQLCVGPPPLHDWTCPWMTRIRMFLQFFQVDLWDLFFFITSPCRWLSPCEVYFLTFWDNNWPLPNLT